MQLELLFEVSNLFPCRMCTCACSHVVWVRERHLSRSIFVASPSFLPLLRRWLIGRWCDHCVYAVFSLSLSFFPSQSHNDSKRTFGQQKQQKSSHQILADGHIRTHGHTNYKRMRQSWDVFFIAFTARWVKEKRQSAIGKLEGNEETIDRKENDQPKLLCNHFIRGCNDSFFSLHSIWASHTSPPLPASRLVFLMLPFFIITTCFSFLYSSDGMRQREEETWRAAFISTVIIKIATARSNNNR